MKIVKNKFKEKIEDGYPADAQITSIKKKKVRTCDIDLISNEFDDMKECIYSSKPVLSKLQVNWIKRIIIFN